VTEDRRLQELREEEEVLAYVREHGYIPIKENDLLLLRHQHLAPAIDRLHSKGVLVKLSNSGVGPRWAPARPWRS
jgi:hypothetical protein